MKSQKQEVWADMSLLNLEVALLLMGKQDDPVVVHGALLNVKNTSPKCQHVQALANLNFELYFSEASVQSMTAHHFLGDLDRAWEMAKGGRNAFALIPAAQLGPYLAFYDGMIAMTILRKDKLSLTFTEKRNFLRRAKKSLKLFRKLTTFCKEFFYPREALLEAELAAWTENVDYAMAKYA